MNRSDQVMVQGLDALRARDFARAEKLFRQVISLDPGRSEAHVRLAMAISGPERTLEAIDCAEAALRLDPSQTMAFGILSGLYQRLGRFDEAIAAAQSVLHLDPSLVPPYADVIRCKRIEESDRPFLDKVELLLHSPGRKPIESMTLHFALGKAHDDLAECAVAARHFEEANRAGFLLFGQHLAYDPKTVERETSELILTYTAEFIQQVGRLGLPSEVPVFIVGMIRSGTTLLDSLLTQHPQIGSAGELKFWELESTRPLTNDEDLRQRAGRFLVGLKLVGDKGRVVDKYPLNYRQVGLIHAALPQARFIHLRRDRDDTCLSVYTTEFGPAAPRFAYRKENITHAYDAYLRLMDHWRQVLPEESLFELDYESLVEESAGSLRQLVSFLGLEWSDRLEGVRTTGGEVLTPSRWQVRQPLYRTSIGKARRYSDALGGRLLT